MIEKEEKKIPDFLLKDLENRWLGGVRVGSRRVKKT